MGDHGRPWRPRRHPADQANPVTPATPATPAEPADRANPSAWQRPAYPATRLSGCLRGVPAHPPILPPAETGNATPSSASTWLAGNQSLSNSNTLTLQSHIPQSGFRAVASNEFHGVPQMGQGWGPCRQPLGNEMNMQSCIQLGQPAPTSHEQAERWFGQTSHAGGFGRRARGGAA